MRPTAGPSGLLTLTLLLTIWAAGRAGAGITERVSVSSEGTQGDRASDDSIVSGNGRLVAFRSFASNLVAGDTNSDLDIFVHDRKTDVTTRVSVDSEGAQANDRSVDPSLSKNGRFVVFTSDASNLVLDDTNGASDVFLHDRKTGKTTCVSVDSAGSQGNGASHSARISANGRFVAFESAATNLVSGDTNGKSEIFVHDRKTGETTRVSVDSSGAQANDFSEYVSISASGRFVAFGSNATNLVADDTNAAFDLFVHDRKTGQITRVSLDSAGNQADDNSYFPSLSANGRHVAFESAATNLVQGDSNGTLDVFHHDRKKGVTRRVSIGLSVTQGNGGSLSAAISANGRRIVFQSDASNLVDADTNNRSDIFLHDRKKGVTIRVSVDSAGSQANHDSSSPVVSAKGRHVVFHSVATNLAPDDTNGQKDVFIRKVN